jgi:hypothetical protein
MARFYFRVRAANQSSYAYCVEAVDQKTADASITGYTGVREWERVEANDIPAGMSFKPSQKAPKVWESK